MSRRDEWSPRLDLRPLLTPISDCVRLKLGLAHQDVVDKLEAGQFDQAPVVDGHGKVVGIIDTLVLRQRTHIGEPIRLSDCRTTWLPPSTDMETTLSELLDSRSFLVRKKDGPCLGLVSVSDLNHHEFRVAVYSLLSRLEVQLAHVVRQSFQDPMGLDQVFAGR